MSSAGPRKDRIAPSSQQGTCLTGDILDRLRHTDRRARYRAPQLATYASQPEHSAPDLRANDCCSIERRARFAIACTHIALGGAAKPTIGNLADHITMLPETQSSSDRTSLWLWLTLGYATLLVYATLFPLSGWRPPTAPLWVLLLDTRQATSYADVVTNGLVYIPFGFAFFRAMPPACRGAQGFLIVSSTGALMSLGLESLQAYMPGRVPSWTDIVLNTASAAIGASLAVLSQRHFWLGRRLLSFRQRHLCPDVVTNLGIAALALWALSQLSPLIPSLDYNNLRQGLKPIWYTANGLLSFDIADFSVYAFSAMALSIVADSTIEKRFYRLKFVSMFFIAVLLLKVPIVGRQLSLEAVVGVAVALGAYMVMQRLSGRLLLSVATLGILGTVLISGLSAGTDDPGAIRPMSWVPFQTNLSNPLTGLLDILGGVWPFVALAYIAIHSRPGRLTAIAGAVGIFALVFFIEWKQQYIPGRYPDLTDALVALLGWSAPWAHRPFRADTGARR